MINLPPAQFPAARPWAEYPRITIDEVLERYPELESSWGESEDDRVMLRDNHKGQSFLLVVGDIYVSSEQIAQLLSLDVRVIVEGSLDVQGEPSRFSYVSGDLYCDSIQLAGTYDRTGWDAFLSFPRDGRVVARCLATASAEDHESMKTLPKLRLETPYLFLWFCNLDDVQLSDETIVFIIGDWEYCQSLSLPNAVFSWRASLYPLAPEFCFEVEGSGADGYYWDTCAMVAALLEGRAILKPGFDPACMSDMETGDEAMSLREWQQAWVAYREAVRVSPCYFPAWYNMGEALYQANGYQQAVACYLEAAKCFPQDQRSLANGGLNMAALCALRLQEWQKATDLATQSIMFNQAAKGYWQEDFAFAYRIRGEARLLAARDSLSGSEVLKDNSVFNDAGDDLRKALELDSWHGSSNWVMGLWHFLRGEESQALTFHGRAQHKGDKFSPWYDAARDSNALLGKPTTLNWEPMASGSKPTKDEDYWCRYLSSRGPDGFAKVPNEMRTAKACLAAIKGRHGWLKVAEKFPAEAFTLELAERLVRASGANLKYVPEPLLSKSLCLLATEEEGQFNAECLPVGIFDDELVRHALACGASLKEIPKSILTRELCYLAIRKSAYALESVPPEFLDNKCYVTAVTFCSPYFFDNEIPSIFKTPDILKQALALDKHALDAISGHAFSIEVFEHAQLLYGRDDDWTEIVARHSPEHAGMSNPAENCWEALWDEQFILEQIEKKDLFSWQIPAHRYSQVVADAAFRQKPIHLAKIPFRFVQPWMAKHFGAMYPDMLDRVPVALRTPELCAAAVASDASNLVHVPLACRTVDCCYQAMIASSGYDDAIPQAVYSEVFDRLLNSPDEHNHFRNWLLLNRGNGYAFRSNPDYARALADFQAVLDDLAGEEDEDIEERHQSAYHSMAQCFHRLGRHDEAQACLDKLPNPEHWPELDEDTWIEPMEPVDFDTLRFDALMYDIDTLKNAGAYNFAWPQNVAAEWMLVEAGSDNNVLWAHVLDNKRFLAYELEQWDDNEAACREIVERLDGSGLWDYLDSDNVIRHALRGAHYRLTLLGISEESSLADLEDSYRRLKDDVFDQQGAIEDNEALDCYLEGYAWMLLLLSRHQEAYAKEAQEVLERIRSSSFVEVDTLRNPLVVEALAQSASGVENFVRKYPK